MKAFSRVVAELDALGGTRLAVLHSESPLLLRRTGGAGRATTAYPVGGGAEPAITVNPVGGGAGPVTTVNPVGGGAGPATTVHLVGGGAGPATTVHLVGGGAGPLRGDDLRLDIAVSAGATLEIRSVAAQLALPGRGHLPRSRLEITATVATGGTLRWLPEPLIAAAGCDHLTVTRVDVEDGGSLLWRDDLVCGRHNEISGDVRMDTTIRYAGRVLYRHELAVGPAAPGWSGAAVLGGGRAIGTLIAAPTGPAPRSGPGDFAVMPLAGPGVLATAVAADIRPVRAALDPLCELRPEPAR